MYSFELYAAISGEFMKSSEMVAHNLNAYTNFLSMFLRKKVPKMLRRLF